MPQSLFTDEEPPLPPQTPKLAKPLNRRQRFWTAAASLVVATITHGIIKDHLTETKKNNIQGMREVAEEQGEPLVVTETKNNIGEQVARVLEGDKPQSETNTTIINPPGHNPPVQIITPDATIFADENGTAQEIIPHNETDTPPTQKEAQETVDDALKDAAKETLPEKQTTPLTPPKP